MYHFIWIPVCISHGSFVVYAVKLDAQASVDEFDLSAVFGKMTFWSEAKGVEIEFPIDLDRNPSLSRQSLGYSTPA